MGDVEETRQLQCGSDPCAAVPCYLHCTHLRVAVNLRSRRTAARWGGQHISAAAQVAGRGVKHCGQLEQRQRPASHSLAHAQTERCGRAVRKASQDGAGIGIHPAMWCAVGGTIHQAGRAAGSAGQGGSQVPSPAYHQCRLTKAHPWSSVICAGCEQPLSPSTAIVTAQLGSVSIVSVRLLRDSQVEAQGLNPQLLLLARGLAAEVTTFMNPAAGGAQMCQAYALAQYRAATSTQHARHVPCNRVPGVTPTVGGLLGRHAGVNAVAVCHDNCLAKEACYADGGALEVGIGAGRAGAALGLAPQRLVPVERACKKGNAAVHVPCLHYPCQ